MEVMKTLISEQLNNFKRVEIRTRNLKIPMNSASVFLSFFFYTLHIAISNECNGFEIDVSLIYGNILIFED